jgi:DNA mismatch repair protein MutS
VETYGDAVGRLAQDLRGAEISSRGLRNFREYLTNYAASGRFSALRAETKKLKDDLAGIRYNLLLKGDQIRVSGYEGESDYSAEVEATFEKFKQGAVKDDRVGFPRWEEMNHVEAAVLDMVAKLHPDTFQALDDYRVRHDKTIADFDREVQFYVAYLEYMARFTHRGLTFCFPTVSDRSRDIQARDTFDLALAGMLAEEKKSVVCNDFFLKDPERIPRGVRPQPGRQDHAGPNVRATAPPRQPRAARAGPRRRTVPVRPAVYARRKEEDVANLRGKLEDDPCTGSRTSTCSR